MRAGVPSMPREVRSLKANIYERGGYGGEVEGGANTSGPGLGQRERGSTSLSDLFYNQF